MKKTVFLINELNGYAWECAMKNVLQIYNEQSGQKQTTTDWIWLEKLTMSLKVKFNENGDIV